MNEVFERGSKAEPPVRAVKLYPDSAGIQKLAAICEALQGASGAEPFFLSCRKAAEYLGTDHMTASRWLLVLLADGFLELVEKGGTARTVRKASRYRVKS